MATPSITAPGMQGKDGRAGSAIGRVELLGDQGAVERGWDIGLGRWTLGTSPSSNIPIAADPTLEPFHVELTVGKRYTLLKASGPVCIGGRSVREWLIDRSTLVECGSRRLMIHPNIQRAPAETGVVVVAEDRIPEVASRLGIPSQTAAPTNPVIRETESLNIAERDFAKVKRDLEELRATVVSIQSSITNFSDLAAWDQKIERITSQSISAIEEELEERIRGPLHDRVQQLFTTEKSQWQAPMADRIDLLESNVLPRIERWEESLRTTQQGIVDINQQLLELTAAFTELASSRMNDSAEFALANVSDASQNNYEDQDSGQEDAKAEDRGSGLSSTDSEEVFEFQVDDESISLRLSRILGEKMDGRESISASPDVEVSPQRDPRTDLQNVEFEQPQTARDRREEESVPSDSNDRLASQDQPLHRITETAAATRTGPVPFDVAGTPQRRTQNDGRANPLESQAHSSSEEDSIEEYMQRLLNRVRSGQGSEPSPQEKQDSTRNSNGKSSSAPHDDGLSSASLSGMIRANSRRTTSLKPVTQPVTEVKSDMKAFREIANSNARRAIHRSEARRQGSNSIVKLAIMVIAMVSGGVFFFIDMGDDRIRFIGCMVSLIIAGVWGIDAIREFFAMIFARKQAKHPREENAEDEPAKPTKKRKSQS
jgi:hypothetical protein